MEKETGSVNTSATSDTIVDLTSRLRVNDEGADIQETTSNSEAPSVPTPLSISDDSSGANPTAKQPQTPLALTTKVYYHIDVEEMPYCTEVPVPPDKITLGDFKRLLNRSNFKYYCKAPSPDPAVFSEVKVELRDDNELLRRSAKGHYELFLQTSEGSTHSDGSSSQALRASHHHIVPGPAPTRYPLDTLAYRRAVQQFDQSLASTDSESIVSDMRALPINLRTGINRRQYQPHYLLPGHRAGRRYEDSTIGSESDARLFSDDDERSRVSTSTDITSVSRQHQANAYRKRRNRRKFRQPSRASSFSSITESSMSLDVITVTLNMDTVNFLGISIVGQSSSRGDNGIYVANIMKGGAVALDGRIDPGDMILQVNDISFENFTNDQAVDVLKESVARRGPIKLTVAKMYDGGPRSAFTVPRRTDEPVRPIDTQAWVQHTNAMRGMPSILEGSEGAPTPIPGHYGRPPSSSTVTSNGSAPNTVVGGAHMRLDTSVSKLRVVQAMSMPNSGLEIKDRTWLKIPIPMSFLGSDLVDWLMEHVDGLRDRKEARKYASDLLKEKFICHAVSRSSFTEQCYYKLGEECSDFVRMRQDGNANDQGVRSEVGVILPPQPAGLVTTTVPAGCRNWQTNLVPQGAPSMVSGYASMPISPYPTQNPQVGSGMILGPGGSGILYKGGGGPDVHSQTSSADGSSGSENRRAARAILPPAPLPTLSGPHHLPMGNSASLVAGPSVGAVQNNLSELPQDLTSSRQSFRIAMSQPFEFFVDNL